MPERTKVDAMETVDTAPGVEPLTKAAERGRGPRCFAAESIKEEETRKWKSNYSQERRLFEYIMR